MNKISQPVVIRGEEEGGGGLACEKAQYYARIEVLQRCTVRFETGATAFTTGVLRKTLGID